jgi:hypothetical protein
MTDALGEAWRVGRGEASVIAHVGLLRPLLDGFEKLYQKLQNRENDKKRIKRSTEGFSLLHAGARRTA